LEILIKSKLSTDWPKVKKVRDMEGAIAQADSFLVSLEAK